MPTLSFKNRMPASVKKRLTLLLSIVMMTTPLIACVPEIFSSCPPLVKYSVPFQTKAADQLAGIPKGTPVRILVTHYGQLRDACRALDETNGPVNR